MASSLLRQFAVKLGLDRRDLQAWALYDVANSAFATTIMVAILPVYFNDSIAQDLEPHLRTAYWAYFNTAAMLMVALLSPAFGYLADRLSLRKKLLALFTGTGAIASICLAIVQPGQWQLAGALFAIGCFSFYMGNVFYEALLPHITNENNIHRVSNSGYAIGYLGGGILLAINLAWVLKPEFFGLADSRSGVKLSFISVGICWVLFSLPLFRWVAEPKSATRNPDFSIPRATWQSLTQIVSTLRSLRQYPEVLMFLLAFWAYSDGIGTIMNMATIYGREVGIAANDLIIAILVVQFLGVPCSFLFGPLSHSIGAKNALMLSLAVYTGIAAVGYFMSTTLHFWILAGGVALVQGGSQAVSRSLFAQIIPLQHASEFFGLFSVSSRFAGLFGPLIFGLLAQHTGGSRISILFIVGIFLLGMLLLSRVDFEKGRREAVKPHS